MTRARFEIWEDPTSPLGPLVPWKVQMIDYVASFPTKESAERYVDTIRAYRKKHGLK